MKNKVYKERRKFDCICGNYSTGWTDDIDERWRLIINHWDSKEHTGQRGFMTKFEYIEEIESPINLKIVEV